VHFCIVFIFFIYGLRRRYYHCGRDTPAGDDLVINYIAVKVKVTGTVEEKEDMKIITVKSFKAVPE
jgi:hypothetical protein